MRLTIDSASNGYIITYQDDNDRETSAVFEINPKEMSKGGEELAAAEAMRDVLGFVVDYFGAGGSRYSKARVRIKLEPGDKREDVDENCCGGGCCDIDK